MIEGVRKVAKGAGWLDDQTHDGPFDLCPDPICADAGVMG